jgi:hypothetical protein
LRPIALHWREAVPKELLKQVEEGILERVTRNSGPTPWVSNLVMVPKDKAVRNTKCSPSRPTDNGKPNETIAVRLTCDSKALNKAVRRTRFPSKTIEDLVYQVNGATVFSKLDITKAFHQLEIDESSRNYTTVTTHMGLFRYKRLHMGISSAQESFTEEIRVLLVDLPGQLNMTDDILVYGKDAAEHQDHLMAVLERLEGAGITLNIDKCQFYRSELTFFGLRFTATGISPTEDRCAALRQASEPTNAKELHSFLCTLLYSGRFIPDVCTISAPLWRLTRDKVPWKWDVEEKRAFNDLKTAISTKCMAYFDIKWNTELIVDASPVGLGAVLCQSNPADEKDRRIVCFASRMLTDTERRYSQCEKEALAAVWGCERFWLYVVGKHFTLVTDNRAVQLILTSTKSRPPARIERMALRLSQFDFTVKHCPGKTNVADYYSRHPCAAGTSSFLEEAKTEQYARMIVSSIVPDAMTVEEVAQESRKDPDVRALVDLVSTAADVRRLPDHLSAYKRVYDELSTTKDGILMRGQRLIVPASLREKIVALSHVGHQGIVKSKALVRAHVWFPGLDKLVEKRVQQCRSCQAIGHKPQFEPMQPSNMPERVWQELSGDFFSPMADGNYLFVNHCDYSRWASVDSIRSTSFDQTKPVLEKLFATFGVPVTYKTDNGPPFQSGDFRAFAKSWGFQHRKVTPLWPRANAEVESFMKKLGKIVKTAKLTGRSVMQELQDFMMAYRATPHTTTKVPPAVLMLGRQMNTRIPNAHYDLDAGEYHRIARENDNLAKQRMKTEYDRRMRAQESSISIGSRVLVQQGQPRKNVSILDPEPYTVVGINGSMVTAQRRGHNITRNSSFFKVVHWHDDSDDDVANQGTPPRSSTAPDEQVDNEPRVASEERQLAVARECKDVADAVGSGFVVARKRGRRTAEEQREMDRIRSEEYARRRAANPAQRSSQRVADRSRGGKM